MLSIQLCGEGRLSERDGILFSFAIIPFAGKFKGKANEIDLSLDDLVELLHSVDHHKVVDSGDAVISDEQLEALLDRTLTSQEKKNKRESSSKSSDRPSVPGDQSLFRVIEERDTKGNITREGDDSAPTTDTWHIVGENDSDLNSEEGRKREDMATGVASSGPMVDGDLKGGVAKMEADLGKGSNQTTSSRDGHDQQESSDARGDHKESSVEYCADQEKSSAPIIVESSDVQGESSNLQPSAVTVNGSKTTIVDTHLGENTKTDEKIPTTVDGNVCCEVEPLPNSSKLETALIKADVENCGSTDTPVIESDCVNNVGGLNTPPDNTYSPENSDPTAKAAVCMEGQLASNPETMANDCNGPTVTDVVLESNDDASSNNEHVKSNTTPVALVMNEL